MRYYRMAATEDGHTKAGHGFGLTLALGQQQTPNFARPTAIKLTKTSFA